MSLITKDMIIADILKQAPGTIGKFNDIGMH